VGDGPFVPLFHAFDIVAGAADGFGGEHKEDGGLAGLGEVFFQLFDDADIAPEAFAGTRRVTWVKT